VAVTRASSPSRAAALARAHELWSTVDSATEGPQHGRVRLRSAPAARSSASLWALSQTLHAAVLLDQASASRSRSSRLGTALAAYRRGPAYTAGRRPWPSRRYYDDNAWVVLAASQARWLAGAGTRCRPLDALQRWVTTGYDADGGVRWRERDWSGDAGTTNACSTGAAGVAALRVAGPGGSPEPDELAFARRCRDFLAGRLRLTSGLVADHLRVDGTVEPTVWSYNQGLLIGLEVLLDRSGDEGALRRAREHAELTTEWFGAGDRLWLQPPCFVAVLLRMLLLLHSADLDPRWPAFADAYLDRVFASAGADGGWRGAGIGRYGDEVVLDVAGLTQVAALRALEPTSYALVC
jgi:hypothetical protein